MNDWIKPVWAAPGNVRALVTTRSGGVSVGRYASLNLGDHVGDDTAAVAENRSRLAAYLPRSPLWLRQVHGAGIVDVATGAQAPEGDGSVAHGPGAPCAVLTADCLPVLLCDREGTAVAAAHAGWRGLAAGVLEAAVRAMDVEPGRVLAWLGPAIGPESFEVGEEVRAQFLALGEEAEAAFQPRREGKWLADIYLLARQRLAHAGIETVSGGGFCTYRQAERFYSYRRDGATGRMASLVWLED